MAVLMVNMQTPYALNVEISASKVQRAAAEQTDCLHHLGPSRVRLRPRGEEDIRRLPCYLHVVHTTLSTAWSSANEELSPPRHPALKFRRAHVVGSKRREPMDRLPC